MLYRDTGPSPGVDVTAGPAPAPPAAYRVGVACGMLLPSVMPRMPVYMVGGGPPARRTKLAAVSAWLGAGPRGPPVMPCCSNWLCRASSCSWCCRCCSSTCCWCCVSSDLNSRSVMFSAPPSKDIGCDCTRKLHSAQEHTCYVSGGLHKYSNRAHKFCTHHIPLTKCSSDATFFLARMPNQIFCLQDEK